jgi:hypothetical protein
MKEYYFGMEQIQTKHPCHAEGRCSSTPQWTQTNLFAPRCFRLPLPDPSLTCPCPATIAFLFGHMVYSGFGY